jgi:hypothetical protein
MCIASDTAHLLLVEFNIGGLHERRGNMIHNSNEYSILYLLYFDFKQHIMMSPWYKSTT